MKSKEIKLIKFLPAILWMGIIFYLSHQPAEISSDLSGGLLEKIMSAIRSITHSELVGSYHTLLRKIAHFATYFILSLLMMYAFAKNKVAKKYLITFFIGLIFALSDEFHQLFIQGRAAQIMDVLIDMSGICLGLLLTKISSILLKRQP